MMLMMDERQYFDYLLNKTRLVFHKSSTYKKYGEKNWNFAICETPIQKGKGIFFGLNWGGDDVDVQTEYPKEDKERNWNFVSHSRRYFREYLKTEIEELNYSNLCFFRSPTAYKIHNDDWALAIPLFHEYVDYIKPPWTLLLGSPDYLGHEYLKNKKTFTKWDSKNNIYVHGYIGTLFGKYPFGAVPHPQAHISTEARKAIWQCVVKDNDNFEIDKMPDNR